MRFDRLLIRFLSTADVGALAPERLADGPQAPRVQRGLECDVGQRFAPTHMLGAATDLEEAFGGAAEREGARDFMEAAEREAEEGE